MTSCLLPCLFLSLLLCSESVSCCLELWCSTNRKCSKQAHTNTHTPVIPAHPPHSNSHSHSHLHSQTHTDSYALPYGWEVFFYRLLITTTTHLYLWHFAQHINVTLYPMSLLAISAFSTRGQSTGSQSTCTPTISLLFFPRLHWSLFLYLLA